MKRLLKEYAAKEIDSAFKDIAEEVSGEVGALMMQADAELRMAGT